MKPSERQDQMRGFLKHKSGAYYPGDIKRAADDYFFHEIKHDEDWTVLDADIAAAQAAVRAGDAETAVRHGISIGLRYAAILFHAGHPVGKGNNLDNIWPIARNIYVADPKKKQLEICAEALAIAKASRVKTGWRDPSKMAKKFSQMVVKPCAHLIRSRRPPEPVK